MFESFSWRAALAIGAGAVAAGCATAPLPQNSLKFPTEAATFFRPANLKQTVIFRPSDGTGPFPAVVLLHTCGGVGPHLYNWAQRLTQAGYVALIVDSNTPRGVTSNCQGAYAPVTLDDVAGDASAALAHLRTLAFVQRDRLGVIGFSWGAMASIRLAGASYQQRLVHGAEGLRAIASFYPGCGSDSPNPAAQATYKWGDDIITPVMLLLGAIDDESPPQFCTGKADRLRARGQPILYKVYANTTHSFDSPIWGLQGREIRHGTRGPFLYRYNPDATEDAWHEVRALFDRHLKNPN
jgi:dienelactone hydrolase